MEVRTDRHSGLNYVIYPDGLPDTSLYFVMHDGDLVIFRRDVDEPIIQNMLCDDAVMDLLGY